MLTHVGTNTITMQSKNGNNTGRISRDYLYKEMYDFCL